MYYLTLHTTRQPSLTRDFSVLCRIKTNHIDHTWVEMTGFIAHDASHYNTTNHTYTYCQACKDLITPMDYLNAVEL